MAKTPKMPLNSPIIQELVLRPYTSLDPGLHVSLGPGLQEYVTTGPVGSVYRFRFGVIVLHILRVQAVSLKAACSCLVSSAKPSTEEEEKVFLKEDPALEASSRKME